MAEATARLLTEAAIAEAITTRREKLAPEGKRYERRLSVAKKGKRCEHRRMELDALLNLMPWILPPILGAIIGYGTNRIAIQMLFRPREAKKILGLTVPMPPGIIPKSREELARSVAQTVARELLSPESIRSQMGNDRLTAGLRTWISSQRRSIMQSPIFPRGVNPPPIDDLIEEILPPLIRSRYVADAVNRLAAVLIADLGQRRLEETIRAEDIAGSIHRNLPSLLAGPGARTGVSRILKDWLDEQIAANRPLGNYVPKNLRKFLLESMSDNISRITPMVVATLRRPTARDAMIRIGRALVEDEIKKQNFLVRAVIQWSGKEKEILDKVTGIVDLIPDKVETALNGPNMREEITSIGPQIIEQVLRTGAGEALGKGKKRYTGPLTGQSTSPSTGWAPYP